MLAERLGARSRRRGREHRLLIVNAIELGSDRAITVPHIDLGSEVGEGGVEVVDLLLESGEVRGHLLEFAVLPSIAVRPAMRLSHTQSP